MTTRARLGAALARTVIGTTVLVAVCAVCGCGSSERANPTRDQLKADYDSYRAMVHAENLAARQRLVKRMEAKLGSAGTSPATMHVLILSGGGDYGAFGAGFLRGWGAVSGEMSRPEFDVVTGVSTGALIAPFAYVGTPEAYDEAVELYSNPKPDWVKTSGLLFFLPGNRSLFNIKGLERDVRAAFDMEMVTRMAAVARENRVLGVNTSNLDYGTMRPWAVGMESIGCVERGDPDRVQRILLASAAIPGAFPAVEIDGLLYADGGVTSNILYAMRADAADSVFGLWEREHPGRTPPRVRFWVIVNNQLSTPPQVTQPTWVSVTGLALSAAIRSQTALAIRHLSTEIKVVREKTNFDVEMRWVCIPRDWEPPVEGAFEKETMKSLAELGERMGRDAASWNGDSPEM